MKKLLVGFFVCFALFGLGTAHASTIDSGSPFPGDSIDQYWYENGVGNGGGNPQNITQIQMEVVSGSYFDVSPKTGIFGFSGSSAASSWSQGLDTGIDLVAYGPSFNPSDLYFTTAFQTLTAGETFLYQGYNGTTLVDSEELTWNGSSWTITEVSYSGPELDPPETVTSAVPEPSCLLLLGGGLVGLAIFSRRFRKV
ncbi:MAG: PEP-CTERM sorting domain-containing protein [Syntrophobacteraceae bacterium]